MSDIMPHLIILFKDSYPLVWSNAIFASGNLTEHYMWWHLGQCLMWLMSLLATFHDAICVAFPQIITLLKDNNSFAQGHGVGTLGQLANHWMY